MQTTALILVLLFSLPASAQDTVVLRADNPPIWGEAPVLVEEVRIGTLNGPEETSFGQVGGIGVMPDGTIWIGDEHLGAIRRYDVNGQFIGQVGRKGEGPGEFSYPSNLRLLPDGHVAVWDPGRIRVSLFDTAGVFRDSFRPPTFMIRSLNLEEFEIDQLGHLYVLGGIFPSEGDAPQRMFWIKMGSSGEVIDSVYLAGSQSVGTVDRIRTQSVLSPLAYLVTARNEEYGVQWRGAAGEIIRVERAWEPVPYESDERKEKQRLEKGFSARNGTSERRIPKTKPPFSSFKVDSEGRFWIEMFAPGYMERETPGERELRERYNGLLREWRQPLVCEVIDPGGEYLGRVEFPNRQTDLVWAHGREVWVIERGEFHEQYLVRYRVQPGNGG